MNAPFAIQADATVRTKRTGGLTFKRDKANRTLTVVYYWGAGWWPHSVNIIAVGRDRYALFDNARELIGPFAKAELWSRLADYRRRASIARQDKIDVGFAA